jgi:hypothetical protein
MKTSSQERTKIENLLRDLENSIHNLQESVRESVFRKDYIEADEKQRELLRLKQFYHDKTEELWKLDSADLVDSSIIQGIII